MENIVLSCYLLKKVGVIFTGFFGRFLVNQLGIFVGDFWEFLVGFFGGVLFHLVTGVFGGWEFLGIPIL